jgi:hypothetical protein
VGAELFHAETDGRTDMTKLKIAFRSFVNKHKTVSQTCFTLNLRTFGISCNVEWQKHTDVSGKRIVSIFKRQALQYGLFGL